MLRRSDGYWAEALRHRRRLEVGGRALWIAAPEDVLLLKLAAGREKDLEVCRQVLAVQLPRLDLDRMRASAERLAARAPDLPERLEALIAEVRELTEEDG